MKAFLVVTMILANCINSLPALYATPQATGSSVIVVWGIDPISEKYEPLLSASIFNQEAISTATIKGDLVVVGTNGGTLSVWKIDRQQRSLMQLANIKVGQRRITAVRVDGITNNIYSHVTGGDILQHELLGDQSLRLVASTNLRSHVNCYSTAPDGLYPSKLTNNRCRIDCSQLQESIADGIEDFECVCKFGYRWTGQQCQQVFQSNCELFEHATTGVSSCSCSAGYQWNGVQCEGQLPKVGGICVGGNCPINCAQVDNSNHTNFNSSVCNCNSNFNWNSTALKCYINCSNITAAVANTGAATCSCSDGFIFTNLACSRNCSNVTNAQSVNPDRVNQCICNAHFSWSTNACVLNCSQVDGAGSTTSNGNACNCNAGRNWDAATYQCLSVSTSNSKLPLALGLGLGIPAALILIGGIAGLIYFLTTRNPPPPPQNYQLNKISNLPYTTKSFAGTTGTTLPPLPSSQLPFSSQLPHMSHIPISSNNLVVPPNIQSRLAITSEANIRAI